MNEKASLLDQLRIERPPEAPRNGRSRSRMGLVLVVVLILGVAAGSWYWTTARANVVPVRAVVALGSSGSSGTATPAPGSLLDASGYVVALRDASVSGKAVYKVEQMLVQQGETVKSGQIIARLDDSNVHAALDQAVAQVKQANATLAQAKLAADDQGPIFKRQQQELAEGLISQDTFDATKASYDAAQAQMAVAEQNLQVDQASVQINQRFEDDTVIRSPFDGVVVAINAQPGQIVSPQFSGGGGLAEIVDMNSLEVDVDVSENFISRVHPGQPATITLDAYPDWHIPAQVIAIIPTADKTKATVEVRVAFKQKDSRVLPQMGARVSFLSDGSEGTTPADSSSAQSSSNSPSTAVLIPAAAVETGTDTGTGTVYVINGTAVVGHSVRLGARSGDNQWVLSGLDPGSSIAIGDLSKLHDGAKIRITS